MDDSKSVIQFPLGFCPGAAKENFVYSNSADRNRRQNATKECQGQWGLVLKEWETITAVSFFVYDNWNSYFHFFQVLTIIY